MSGSTYGSTKLTVGSNESIYALRNRIINIKIATPDPSHRSHRRGRHDTTLKTRRTNDTVGLTIHGLIHSAQVYPLSRQAPAASEGERTNTSRVGSS